jgi:hypothetical protein
MIKKVSWFFNEHHFAVASLNLTAQQSILIEAENFSKSKGDGLSISSLWT